MLRLPVLVYLCFCLFACSAEKSHLKIELPASTQRKGDAQKGYRYLTEGAYITSGIPLKVFQSLKPGRSSNLLDRSGVNATIPYWFTSVKSKHGADIIVPNCLTCHASHINGKFILGLGKFDVDFTDDRSTQTNLSQKLIAGFYGAESPEYKSFFPIAQVYGAVGPYLTSKTVGMNPATRLAYLLFSHRDMKTLKWQDKPRMDLKEIAKIPGSDVPPLWHVKKKNALYYTASGQGDFARLIMSASLLTVDNAGEMPAIEENFINVLEFLKTIEAPKYPGKIDEKLALEGRGVFRANCKECHGTYGVNESFPNLVIRLDEIGTDPLLVTSLQKITSQIELNPDLWLNKGGIKSTSIPHNGYIAPPLDGIWATAPYLHNGSVPDLMSLLKSSERPAKWFRDGRYNINDRVGLDASKKNGYALYDTSLPGNSNKGHTYGDELTDQERTALIEYLKTL